MMEDQKNDTFIEKLHATRERYAGSFTVHGLSHIAVGNIFERIFWILCILLAMVGTVVMTNELFKGYFNNEVVTNIQIVPNTHMKLPAIYICSSSALKNLRSYANCSSTRSKSYDSKTCPSLKKECPEFCADQKCTINMLPVICPQQLYGQCIAVNENGKITQTYAQGSISYILPIKASELPVMVYVKQPQIKSTVISLLYNERITEIKRSGKYDVVVKKTTLKRRSPPYSKCIVEGSNEAEGKNMYLGEYSM